MKCRYKFKFPVDEFGRPGGMYSLADLPVVGYKILERVGTLKKRDTAKKLYELQDMEKNWTLVVPFEDVEIITSPLKEVI
tara:strand:- start:575 stop:814 length:240 start_codon:yes stop_codon:yes gene_type:complete